MDALETFEAKTDKFTAARIRLFQATGMASQRTLPFDRRPSLTSFQWKPAMMLRVSQPARRRAARMKAKATA